MIYVQVLMACGLTYHESNVNRLEWDYLGVSCRFTFKQNVVVFSAEGHNNTKHVQQEKGTCVNDKANTLEEFNSPPVGCPMCCYQCSHVPSSHVPCHDVIKPGMWEWRGKTIANAEEKSQSQQERLCDEEVCRVVEEKERATQEIWRDPAGPHDPWGTVFHAGKIQLSPHSDWKQLVSVRDKVYRVRRR